MDRARSVGVLRSLFILLTVFAVGIVSAGLIGFRPGSSDVPRAGTQRLVALGDSLTRGDGLGADAWYAVLGRRDDRLVDAGNAGVNGNTTGQMLERLDRDVLALSPGIVTVMGGTNDLTRGVATDETIGNLRRIAERLRAAGIHVVLATIPPRRDPAFVERTRTLNERIRGLAGALGLPLAEVYAGTAGADGRLPPENTTDGLHLSAPANVAVAAAMYRAIAPLL